jgi:hypothetical protein
MADGYHPRRRLTRIQDKSDPDRIVSRPRKERSSGSRAGRRAVNGACPQGHFGQQHARQQHCRPLAGEPAPGRALHLRDPLVAPRCGTAGRSGRFGYRLHILLELKTVLGRKTATGRKTALDRLTLYQLLGYVLHDHNGALAISRVALYQAPYGHLAVRRLDRLLLDLADQQVDLPALRHRWALMLETRNGLLRDAPSPARQGESARRNAPGPPWWAVPMAPVQASCSSTWPGSAAASGSREVNVLGLQNWAIKLDSRRR